MPVWLTASEYASLDAACTRLIPSGLEFAGADQARVVDYIDMLLGAFSFDPPHIWAGGPTSGRRGGYSGFANFHTLTALDELAWRIRIEGSLGLPEREWNGPVAGYQELYRTGLAALGEDFVDADPDEQIRRLRSDPEFTDLLYAHCCEGLYGAPEYGGNRDTVGWRSIGFDGDVAPRGWSDDEVSGP